MQDVALFCNNYPDITLSYDIIDSDNITANEQIQINVKLEREVDESDDNIGVVICPRFLNKKLETWWIVIGDPTNNTLCAIKKTPLKVEMSTSLIFNAPEQSGDYKYKLYLVSDSYLGCDQEFELNFKVN